MFLLIFAMAAKRIALFPSDFPVIYSLEKCWEFGWGDKGLGRGSCRDSGNSVGMQHHVSHPPKLCFPPGELIIQAVIPD